MKHILGIDFGTTTTSFSLQKEEGDANPEIIEIRGSRNTETVVRLDEDFRNIENFGLDAWEHYQAYPDRTFYNFKPNVGLDHVYKETVDGQRITADHLATLFLSKLGILIMKREFNGDPLDTVISKTVIGYPAEWPEQQKKAMIDVAMNAGFPNVIGCEEPIGVFYYHFVRRDFAIHPGKNILVYDFGGGTTDITVMRITENGTPQILGCGGSNNLGGRDFDAVIFEWLKDRVVKMSQNQELCEKDKSCLQKYSKLIKEKLSCAIDDGFETYTCDIPLLYSMGGTFSIKISKKEFEILCQPLMNRFHEPLKNTLYEANTTKNDINYSILAGGSGRLYYVDQYLNDAFPNDICLRSKNPQEVIATGLSIYGKHKNNAVLSISSAISESNKTEDESIQVLEINSLPPEDEDTSSLQTDTNNPISIIETSNLPIVPQSPSIKTLPKINANNMKNDDEFIASIIDFHYTLIIIKCSIYESFFYYSRLEKYKNLIQSINLHKIDFTNQPLWKKNVLLFLNRLSYLNSIGSNDYGFSSGLTIDPELFPEFDEDSTRGFYEFKIFEEFYNKESKKIIFPNPSNDQANYIKKLHNSIQEAINVTNLLLKNMEWSQSDRDYLCSHYHKVLSDFDLFGNVLKKYLENIGNFTKNFHCEMTTHYTNIYKLLNISSKDRLELWENIKKFKWLTTVYEFHESCFHEAQDPNHFIKKISNQISNSPHAFPFNQEIMKDFNVFSCDIQNSSFYTKNLNFDEKSDFADIMKKTCRKYLHTDDIYIQPNIPEKKLNNVCRVYSLPAAEILAIYDNTIFGSAKSGFVITKSGLGFRDDFQEPTFIDYSQILPEYFIFMKVKDEKKKYAYVYKEKCGPTESEHFLILNSGQDKYSDILKDMLPFLKYYAWRHQSL